MRREGSTKNTKGRGAAGKLVLDTGAHDLVIKTSVSYVR